MSKFGVIQNEEVLQEVLNTEEMFFIPCASKSDAHSKAVSLNNAKKRLSLFQQRKLRVQRAEVDGEWGVKILPTSAVVVWKIVNGEKILWDPDEGKLSEEHQRMFDKMMNDKIPLEEMIEYLPAEKEAVVRKLYSQVS